MNVISLELYLKSEFGTGQKIEVPQRLSLVNLQLPEEFDFQHEKVEAESAAYEIFKRVFKATERFYQRFDGLEFSSDLQTQTMSLMNRNIVVTISMTSFSKVRNFIRISVLRS